MTSFKTSEREREGEREREREMYIPWKRFQKNIGDVSINLATGRRYRQNFLLHGRKVTLRWVLKWLSCQAPCVIGSVLGVFGPMSVCCDWQR